MDVTKRTLILALGAVVALLAFAFVISHNETETVETANLSMATPAAPAVRPIRVVYKPSRVPEWEIGEIRKCLLTGKLKHTSGPAATPVLTLPTLEGSPYLWCPPQIAFELAGYNLEFERRGSSITVEPNENTSKIFDVKLLNEGKPDVMAGVDGRNWDHCRKTTEGIECQ